MSDLSDRWCFLSCVWCLITFSQIFIGAVHILRRGIRRPKNFPSFSVQNSNIVINFEDPLPTPIPYYAIYGRPRKLLSCHHIWFVNLSAWQVSACQLISLSSFASWNLQSCFCTSQVRNWSSSWYTSFIRSSVDRGKNKQTKNHIKMPDFSGKPQWINYDDLINPRNL